MPALNYQKYFGELVAMRVKPLFADQFEQEGMKSEYFSLDQCQADYAQRTKNDERWMNKWWDAHPDALRVRLPNAGVQAPERSGGSLQ